MNQGQEMFFHFFMERVAEGKEDEARAVLLEGFEKQASGAFTAAYLSQIMPKYFELIKPEFADDLKQAMAHFGTNLK